MSGQSDDDKYIKRKGCNCKFINDDEHIKQSSGYHRLGEKSESCVKCRNKRNTYNNKKVPDTASTTTPDTIEDEQYVIVMGVETNGFIKTRNAQPTPNNISQFPHIVQFSWGFYTEGGDGKVIKNHIIKLNGWLMNGTEKCHGVSQEKAESEGIDIEYVLTQYKHDSNNRCMMRVCHNVNFDVRVVAGEFARAEMEIQVFKTYCTMQEGISYCIMQERLWSI